MIFDTCGSLFNSVQVKTIKTEDKVMKDLIKKYEELSDILHSNPASDFGYKLAVEQMIKDLQELPNTPAFQNNERILLQRLVKDEIATPRKKYGTSKMNTLYSLEGKLRK